MDDYYIIGDELYQIANKYYRKKDYDKAIEHYKKAINKGNVNALYSLGLMYYYEGENHNYEVALEYIRKSSILGNISAQTRLLEYRCLTDDTFDNYLELFKGKVEIENPDDIYLKRILQKLMQNKQIIRFKTFNELIRVGFDNIPNDSIIELEEFKMLDDPNSIYLSFYTSNDLKKIYNCCKRMLKSIDLNQNEEDIFMQIYIKLGLLLSYDYSALELESNTRETSSRNLIGIISGKCICGGYSLILKRFLDMVGIKNVIVNSKFNSKNMGHVYNMVMLNGNWYFCDLTWDEQDIKKGIVPKYCLLSYDTISSDIHHIPLNDEYSKCTFSDYYGLDELYYRNLFTASKKYIY